METWEKYYLPLEFLHHAVTDTQETIRFIDTKAAFFVTLLSGMIAEGFQKGQQPHRTFHNICFYLLLAFVGLSLLLCLQVIFPVIKPQSTQPSAEHGRSIPKFFIHHSKGHHWMRHTFSNSADDVLAEDRESYTATMAAATFADLQTSLSDELVMVSLIRQIKSDRLHSAAIALVISIVCFLAVMVS